MAKCKKIVPKNISDTIYQNVKKGRIAEVKESRDNLKNLYLTNTGEQLKMDEEQIRGLSKELGAVKKAKKLFLRVLILVLFLFSLLPR